MSKLMLAVEDMDLDTPELENDDEIEVPGEVRDAEEEVEETQTTIDDASDDIEKLEEIKDVLEEAADNGEGIDDTAAKVVEVAVESIYARLGFPTTNIIGSVESFKNTRSRVTATKMAAEGIGDRVSQAWEAVKKFFKKLWENIKELYNRYFTAVGRMKAKAKKLRELVARASNTTKADDTFTDKSLAKALLNKDGKLIAGTQLDNTLEAIKAAGEVKSSILDAMSDVNNASPKMKAALEKMFSEKPTADVRVDGGANEDAICTKTLVGNKIILCVASKDMHNGAGNTTIQYVRSYDIYVHDLDTVKDHEDVEVTEKANLIQYCEKVIRICDAISDATKKDKDYDKALKAIDRLEKVGDKLGKSKNTSVAGGGKSTSTYAKMVREVVKNNGKLSVLPKKVAISGCARVLTYVAKCRSKYEKAD